MIYITSLLAGNAHRMIYLYIINNRIDLNPIKELCVTGVIRCVP